MREVIEMIELHMIPGQRRHRICRQFSILASLRFLVCGSYQRCVGHNCFINLSQSQISISVNEVTHVIERHLNNFIHFPSQAEYTAIKRTYKSLMFYIDFNHVTPLPSWAVKNQLTR